jgi:hypothetical protein
VSAINTVILIVGIGFLALIEVGIIWAVITGRDLRMHDEDRIANPKRYRYSRAVGRINGPLVTLMCGGFLAAMVRELLRGEPFPSWMFLALLVFAFNFWFSARWTFWAWRGVTLRELNVNTRLSDNVIQAAAIGWCALAGGAVCYVLAEGDLAAVFLGAFAGMVLGLLASGTALMIYRFFRPADEGEDTDGSGGSPP